MFSTYSWVGRLFALGVCVWKVFQFPCCDSRGGSGRGVGNLVIAVPMGSGGRLLLFVLVCSLREVLCRASALTVLVGV